MGSKTCQLCGEVKSLQEFHKNKQIADGKHTICKVCNRDKVKQWRKDNPEKYKGLHYKGKYGITLGQFNLMREQANYRCQICHLPEEECPRGTLYVDHCHNSNNVRGLLCQSCNNMLGAAYDNPETLLMGIKYLRGEYD